MSKRAYEIVGHFADGIFKLYQQAKESPEAKDCVIFGKELEDKMDFVACDKKEALAQIDQRVLDRHKDIEKDLACPSGKGSTPVLVWEKYGDLTVVFMRT